MAWIIKMVLQLLLGEFKKYAGKVRRRRDIQEKADKEIADIHARILQRHAGDAIRDADEKVRERLRNRFNGDD